MKIVIAKNTITTLAKDSADLVAITLEAFGGVTPRGEEIVKSVKDVPLEVTTEHENFSIIYDAVTGEYTIWLNDDLIIRQWKQHNVVSAAIIKAAGALAFVVKPMLENLSEIFDSWSKKKKVADQPTETEVTTTSGQEQYNSDQLMYLKNNKSWLGHEKTMDQTIKMIFGDSYVPITHTAGGFLCGYAFPSKPDNIPENVKIVQLNDFWVYDVTGIDQTDVLATSGYTLISVTASDGSRKMLALVTPQSLIDSTANNT